MGGHTYSSVNRSTSDRHAFYNASTTTVDQIFTQNQERRIHPDMDPSGIVVRESRDSEANPNSMPIIIGLDLTASMGYIPHGLIKTGLPTMVGSIIQNGVPDPAILFIGVGDHEVDRAPLQVGQFESGDEQLDMWLTRTYLEGGGGGNAGESYLLAWYFAAFHTVHDAFEKRNKKGYLITIGDELCLPNLPVASIKRIMGDSAVGQSTFSAAELLDRAREKYHIYHIDLSLQRRSQAGKVIKDEWKQLLGDNLIDISREKFEEIPEVIKSLIVGAESTNPAQQVTGGSAEDTEEIL